MSKSMMGSSKYEFEVEEFEKDFVDKMEVSQMFRESIESAIYNHYPYRNGTEMSNAWKRIILAEVHKKFIEEAK